MAAMSTDLEASDAWLERLYSLNAVVAASGEPVAGNLFYEHRQTDYLSSPPVSSNRAKRDRFRGACDASEQMLEIGVNGGHSAYLALSSNPTLQFTGVDICEHAYVHPAVEWLKAEFPGRVAFYEGSCLTLLPRLAKEGARFDLFHIDGGKHTYYRDVLNAHRMTTGGSALVVLDDVNQGGVRKMWERCLREGLLEPSPEFPSMPASEERRNEIARLPSISSSRLGLLRLRSSLRDSRRRWRLKLAR
jgi:predicted O-methyltransferase YrrM